MVFEFNLEKQTDFLPDCLKGMVGRGPHKERKSKKVVLAVFL